MTINVQPSGALDIGSYQSKFIIFKIDNSKIYILSKIVLKTEGIKKGFISDLPKLKKLINELIGKAEDAANLQIKKVYLSISSLNCSFISFCNSKNIGGYEVENQKDVQFLINDSVNLFKDCYPNCDILHLFNTSFRTDKINIIENPTGLLADSLQNEIHLVFLRNNILKNFINLITNNNLKLEKIIFAPYVLGLLTYTESPLSDASITIDFGHEKTSVTIFKNDNLILSFSIPIGSWHVTNDIAKSLNLNLDIAESLKINHSSCKNIDNDIVHKYIESENLGFKSYKKISNNILNKIVSSRVEEIIDYINHELIYFRRNKQHFNKIVITGEGSKIKGFFELLEKKLLVKFLTIEKLSCRIKNNIADEFDVCLSVINYISKSYNKEIKSNSNPKKNFFHKLYSIFN